MIQAQMLALIDEQPGLNISQLAGLLHLTTAETNAVINEMVQDGRLRMQPNLPARKPSSDDGGWTPVGIGDRRWILTVWRGELALAEQKRDHG